MKDQPHPLNWKIVDSTRVIDTPHLRLRKDVIDLPGGLRIDSYFVRESAGFAVIFAQTEDGRIVLVRQYKHGIGEFVRELPAGAIDPGEDPLDCAVRELAEETGYVGAASVVATFVAEPTNSTARLYLCRVEGARLERAQALDATEAIEVELATRAQVLAMVRSGAITPIAQIACIYYMFDRLGWLDATAPV